MYVCPKFFSDLDCKIMTLTIRQIDWDNLPLDEVKALADLAKQYFSTTQTLSTITVAAYDDDIPCGIAIAPQQTASRTLEIEHLAIDTRYIGQGVSELLFKQMEEIARKHDCLIILYLYPNDIANRKEIEAFLQKEMWQPPKLLLHRYFYDCQLFDTPWLQQQRLLPSEFTLHPWSDLTDMEKHRMDVQVSQGAYPYSVYPYGKGGTPEPINSIFLRCSGRIVAWLATHREDANTIIYSGLYVHADHRGRSLSVYLLADSIKRQKASPIRMACFELNESQVSDLWAHFIKENVAPQALNQIDLYTTWKDLRSKPHNPTG